MRRYRFRGVHEPAPELSSGIGKYTKDYSNLPERYIVRKSARVIHKSEDHPSYVPRLDKWEAQHHRLERPWTGRYWQENPPFDDKRHPDIVQPIREQDWMWFRGDRVEVLTGDDKGKQGYIVLIVQERNWVFVENLNCKYNVEGKSATDPGNLMKEELPLLVTTDIKLVDPTDEMSCDVVWKYDENGERVRVSTRTGRILPVPGESFKTKDYNSADNYDENKEKDTPAKIVEELTFEPRLATFEMDIMNEMNIKEDRIPKKTFWY